MTLLVRGQINVVTYAFFILCTNPTQRLLITRKIWVVDKWNPQIFVKFSDQMQGFHFGVTHFDKKADYTGEKKD